MNNNAQHIELEPITGTSEKAHADTQTEGVNYHSSPSCRSILGDEAFYAAIESVPSRYREMYRRALLGAPSYRNAISIKCAECCGFEDVSRRVGECGVYRCPLWAYRPYRESSEVTQ